jgi:hypothetical protein
MIGKISCTAVVCLLLAGCSGLGGSSRGPGGALKLIPSRLDSPASKESLAEAVANDPFPSAGQGDVSL